MTDASSMFRGAASFNQDLSGWDVSGVKDTSSMFQGAASFDASLSRWNVSGVIDMSSMFDGAASFEQNLGEWYVTVDDASIGGADVPGIVGTILAQNAFLDGQDPVYGIGAGADSEHFAVVGENRLAMASLDGARTYVANVTASGPKVFEDGNNWATVTVSVQGAPPSTPLSVDAGIHQNVNEGDAVTLAGIVAGALPSDLTYAWVQTSPESPQASLDDAASRTVTFEAPQVNKTTTFAFTLTATAGTDSASGLVTVTVIDDAPGPAGLAVHAEARHDAYEGDPVTLSGTAAGVPSSALTYMWAQTSPASPRVSFDDASARTATFEAPQVDGPTTFAFTLTATDGTDSVSDSVTVRILDAAADPGMLTVHAESHHAAYEGNQITLSGSAAGAPQGSVAYRWAQASPESPQASLGDATARTITFDAPPVESETIFTFTLNATAGNRSATDLVTVTVLDVSGPAVPGTGVPGTGVPGPGVPGTGVPGTGLSRTDTKFRLYALPPAITIGSAGYPNSAVPERVFDAVPETGAPVESFPAGGEFDFPLEIDGNGYALRRQSSTLVPQNVTAGEPVSVKVTLYDRYEIAYFAVHLGLDGGQASHLDDDARVAYERGTVLVADPGGILAGASLSLLQDPRDPYKKTAVLDATFSEAVGTAGMVIRTWNVHGEITTVQVIDALRVVPAADPAGSGTESGAAPVTAPEPAVDPDPAGRALQVIRAWAGFAPDPVTDADLLATLGLDYPGVDIPNWMMTELGVLVAKGLVTVEEFRTALEYVLEAR